jgi:hypothetical protein
MGELDKEREERRKRWEKPAALPKSESILARLKDRDGGAPASRPGEPWKKPGAAKNGAEPSGEFDD